MEQMIVWAIRNSNYKLIVNANGNEEMFDMIIRPI